MGTRSTRSGTSATSRPGSSPISMATNVRMLRQLSSKGRRREHGSGYSQFMPKRRPPYDGSFPCPPSPSTVSTSTRPAARPRLSIAWSVTPIPGIAGMVARTSQRFTRWARRFPSQRATNAKPWVSVEVRRWTRDSFPDWTCAPPQKCSRLVGSRTKRDGTWSRSSRVNWYEAGFPPHSQRKLSASHSVGWQRVSVALVSRRESPPL